MMDLEGMVVVLEGAAVWLEEEKKKEKKKGNKS